MRPCRRATSIIGCRTSSRCCAASALDGVRDEVPTSRERQRRPAAGPGVLRRG
jgi:hypothetical protein